MSRTLVSAIFLILFAKAACERRSPLSWVLDRSVRSVWQVRRLLTFQVVRTSSTSWRRRAGLRAFLRACASQHRRVQAQVGLELLQLAVLLLELTQPPHLGQHQSSVLLAPGVRDVASLIPALRHASPMAVPSSACISTKASLRPH